MSDIHRTVVLMINEKIVGFFYSKEQMTEQFVRINRINLLYTCVLRNWIIYFVNDVNKIK